MDRQIKKTKNNLKESKKIKIKKSSRISNLRLIIFILIIIEIIVYLNSHTLIHLLGASLLFILFIAIVIIHRKIDDEIDKIDNSLNIIKRYEDRTSDDWKKEEYNFDYTNESFLEDLNIVGQNSLLKYLDFTWSLGGKNKLAKTLSLKSTSKKIILENQKAIQMLKSDFPFIVEFQAELSIIDSIEKYDFSSLTKIFDKKIQYKKSHLYLSLALSLMTIILLILSIFSFIHYVIPILFMLAGYSVSYIYERKYSEVFEDISKSSQSFGKLKNIFNYLESIRFTDKKNIRLQKNINEGHKILNELIHITNTNMYRTNFITNFIMNALFSLNFIIVYLYTSLLSEKTVNFKNSIDSLEEFEVLISLTTLGLVKENTCIPNIIDDLKLETKNIKHPLLLESNCIANNFSCLKDLNIITGSNMSGKTSFMRTIGVNLVLAYTGSCVCADHFEAPIMKIFTSINVKDDIANGISTFYEELRRVKEMLDYSETRDEAMIVFIDEIFKGTNYNDRILGAEYVLKKLSDLNCIVFLTTHDFELCEIKSKKIYNYHFSETYNGDKIHFDYKIKEGQCKTTNAKYLMKKMGIIDK